MTMKWLIATTMLALLASGCGSEKVSNPSPGDIKANIIMSKANQRLAEERLESSKQASNPEVRSFLQDTGRQAKARANRYNQTLKSWRERQPKINYRMRKITDEPLAERALLDQAIEEQQTFLVQAQAARKMSDSDAIGEEIGRDQNSARNNLLTLREMMAAFYPDPRSDTATASYPKGNQNRTNLAIITCKASHLNNDDPIVHAGRPGLSHRHQFFGNSKTSADPSLARLRKGETSCSDKKDLSAYWVAALLDKGGHTVEPTKIRAYYGGNGGNKINPFPTGLRMIAGRANSLGWQDPEIAGWACNKTALSEPEPPSCPKETILRLRFPDCWNGRQLDSKDHYSHVAYSRAEKCPRGYPKKMVQLRLDVHYPVTNILGPDGRPNYYLSSGPIWTIHGDFLNLWVDGRLQQLVADCVVRGRNCPQ